MSSLWKRDEDTWCWWRSSPNACTHAAGECTHAAGECTHAAGVSTEFGFSERHAFRRIVFDDAHLRGAICQSLFDAEPVERKWLQPLFCRRSRDATQRSCPASRWDDSDLWHHQSD